MAKFNIDTIIQNIDQAVGMYHRLVLLVGISGKTEALQEIQKQRSIPLINVNLELSRRMLELTERQRALQLPRLLSEIVESVPSDVVLMDNMEILFAVSLKQDPMRLIQGLSRNKTIVAAWGGTVSGQTLSYAVPGHPEYRKYQIKEFIVVSHEKE